MSFAGIIWEPAGLDLKQLPCHVVALGGTVSMTVQDALTLQDASGRNAWSGRKSLMDFLEALALSLIGGDEGRELILQIVLGGKQVAQSHRKHLLLQFILDGEHERTQARQVSA